MWHPENVWGFIKFTYCAGCIYIFIYKVYGDNDVTELFSTFIHQFLRQSWNNSVATIIRVFIALINCLVIEDDSCIPSKLRNFLLLIFSLLNMINLMRLSIYMFSSKETIVVEFLASSRFSWQWWRNKKGKKYFQIKRSSNENAREWEWHIYLFKSIC